MFGIAADTGAAFGVAFHGDGGGAQTGALDGYGAAAGPDVPDQVSRSRTEAREYESPGRRLRDHARPVLELSFGERPPQRTLETGGDPTFLPASSLRRARVPRSDLPTSCRRPCLRRRGRSVRPPTELLRDHEAAAQTVERLREFGWSEVGEVRTATLGGRGRR